MRAAAVLLIVDGLVLVAAYFGLPYLDFDGVVSSSAARLTETYFRLPEITLSSVTAMLEVISLIALPLTGALCLLIGRNLLRGVVGGRSLLVLGGAAAVAVSNGLRLLVSLFIEGGSMATLAVGFWVLLVGCILALMSVPWLIVRGNVSIHFNMRPPTDKGDHE